MSTYPTQLYIVTKVIKLGREATSTIDVVLITSHDFTTAAEYFLSAKDEPKYS